MRGVVWTRLGQYLRKFCGCKTAWVTIRAADFGPDDPLQRLFDLAAAQFMLDGTWPSLRALRRAAAQRGEEGPAFEPLPQIPAHLGGYGLAGGDSVSLSAAGLAKTERGRQFLPDLVRFAQQCCTVYISTADPPRVTAGQLRDSHEMSEATIARITALVSTTEGYLITSGSPTPPEDSWWDVNESALKFKGVTTLEGFLEVRDQLRPPQVPQVPAPGTYTGLPALAPRWSEVLDASPASDTFTIDSLHPQIAEAARDLFFTGKPEMAVLEAAKALAANIRQVSGLTSDGTPLVEEAFGRIQVGDPDTRTGKNFHEGTRLLALGIMKSMRNLVAHSDDYSLTHVEAFEALALISLVARRLDSASRKNDSDP